MAAVVPAGTAGWGFKVAASALVLATLSWPRAADAQSPKLEAAYMVLGPRGPVARGMHPSRWTGGRCEIDLFWLGLWRRRPCRATEPSTLRSSVRLPKSF